MSCRLTLSTRFGASHRLLFSYHLSNIPACLGAWMTPRIPGDCWHSGSRFEDGIEGSGMDSEDASDLADGLSFLNEPISQGSVRVIQSSSIGIVALLCSRNAPFKAFCFYRYLPGSHSDSF